MYNNAIYLRNRAIYEKAMKAFAYDFRRPSFKAVYVDKALMRNDSALLK